MRNAATALILFILAVFLVRPVQCDEIHVAAASNARGVLQELAARFEQDSGHELVLIFGSTGKQYAQVVNGAPFDVFLAADAERPEKLEAAGLIVEGSRFTYALGRLVLWSADDSRVDSNGRVLESDSFRRLAIANPDLAPYGRAAMEVIDRLDRRASIRDRLVVGENVGQAFQFVASNNAELGFVAWSQLHLGDAPMTGSWWLVPESLHGPIEQQAVQLRAGPVAESFLAFLRGEKAIEILRAHGYGVPDDF